MLPGGRRLLFFTCSVVFRHLLPRANLSKMEPRRTPPEYFLEIFADTTTVRDILKGIFFFAGVCFHVYWQQGDQGILNLIFFHRYFPSIRPTTFDVLDLTLPAINDVDLETLIDSRVTSLVRQHLSSTEGTTVGATGGGGVRGRIAVEFYEKKRRRTGGGMWFGGLAGKMAGGGSTEEEVCWETWTLDVTIATPRTESGMFFMHGYRGWDKD